MPDPTSPQVIPACLVLNVRQTWGVFAVAVRLPRPVETVVPAPSGRPRRERNDTWRNVYGLVVPGPLAAFNARAIVQRAIHPNMRVYAAALGEITWVEPSTLPPGILRSIEHLSKSKNPLSQAMRSARLIALMEHHGPICHWCQRFVQVGVERGPDVQATIEHLIPQRDGGSDASHNLAVSCYSCNQMRGSQEHSPLLF